MGVVCAYGVVYVHVHHLSLSPVARAHSNIQTYIHQRVSTHCTYTDTHTQTHVFIHIHTQTCSIYINIYATYKPKWGLLILLSPSSPSLSPVTREHSRIPTFKHILIKELVLVAHTQTHIHKHMYAVYICHL